MKKTIEALARAYQEVKEGRFVIPEEVPANERTAFHGAAAAAYKDGKTHFNFGGKKYPVTMKKDTATAIADDVKEDVENEMMHNDKVILKSKKKKKGEDDPDGENSETAVMNPKNENVRTADKKPEMYIGRDGKKHVRMVPVDREVIKTKRESTDMSIREKLLSVLESDRAAHYKGATKPEEYDEKSKSSKGAMDMLNTPKEVGADIKKATDDNAKAEKKAKVSPKNSTDKDVKGDMKIINPVVDITQKAGMKESFSKTVKSIATAYQSMYEKYTHEVDYHESGYDHTADTFVAKAKKAGLKAKVHDRSGPGGGNPVVHLGHSDEGKVHDFLKKHYSKDHDMSDTKAARLHNESVEESFKHYTVTHKSSGKQYRVTAMSHNSAKDKARQMHGGTASRYTGTSNSDFHVESTNLDEDYYAMKDAERHAAKDGKNYHRDVSVQHKYDAYHMKKHGYTHFEPGSYGTRRYTKGPTGHISSTKIEPHHYSGISGV